MKHIALLFVLFIGMNSWAQENNLSPAVADKVNELIAVFQNNDKEEIANHIGYPLNRSYPIPEVNTAKELVVRFDQIFDKELINAIAKSTLDDWSTVGWRGTMLKDGLLWMDDNGIIYRINRDTPMEQKWRKSLIQQDRTRLHKSVQKYKEPYAVIDVEGETWRIDNINDEVMRLVIWKKGVKMNEHPALVLEGCLDLQGSMGTRVLEFKNKKTTEEITILLDAQEIEALHGVSITITDKKGKEISKQGVADN